MSPYQKRMTPIVWALSIYSVALPIYFLWKGASSESWFIYGSTLVIVYCPVTGFDAVYDSISEKLPPTPWPDE